jgi:hypothetical protein
LEQGRIFTRTKDQKLEENKEGYNDAQKDLVKKYEKL